MKKIITFLFICIAIISCSNTNEYDNKSWLDKLFERFEQTSIPIDTNTINEDSVYTDTIKGTNNELVETFFYEAQEASRVSLLDTSVHNELKERFHSKMCKDINFAKAAATYNDMYYGGVVFYCTHSEFTKENGKHGVNNVYDIVVNVPVIGPDTCDVTVAVKYQIVCEMMIFDDTHRPNVSNIVRCTHLDEPVVKSDYANIIDLGTYVLEMP